MSFRLRDDLRQVLAQAQAESLRTKSSRLSSGHILLALLVDGVPARRLLESLDVNVGKVRLDLETMMGQDSTDEQAGPHANSALSVMPRALEAAQRLNHMYVGSEHLLLGILTDDGIAGRCLRNSGLTTEVVRDGFLAALATRPGGPPAPLPFTASCPMCALLQAPERHPSFIATLDSSHVILSDNQGCRGWCVLVLKDHEEHLDELPFSMQSMIFEDVARAARALRSIFPTSGKDGLPPRINYECLGNLVPHIHWHIIPRHADDPDPTKTVWTWPDSQLKGAMTQEERTALITKLRSAIR